MMMKMVMSFWVGASETGGRQGEKSNRLKEHLGFNCESLGGLKMLGSRSEISQDRRRRTCNEEGGGGRCSRRLGSVNAYQGCSRSVKW